MTMMPPFTPAGCATATSGAGSSSAATALAKTNQQARLTNPSGGTQALAFVAFGSSSVAATAANGVAILPGESFVVTPPSEATHFAVFSAAATAVYVSSGIGE